MRKNIGLNLSMGAVLFSSGLFIGVVGSELLGSSYLALPVYGLFALSALFQVMTIYKTVKK